MPSLSIGALALDPTDDSYNTLVAGVGQVSSYGMLGGASTGLYRTTDGGATWTWLTHHTWTDVRMFVSGVAVRGPVIVVSASYWGYYHSLASVTNGEVAGLFRSEDAGESWQFVSGDADTGLPTGAVLDLASDPRFDSVLYCIVVCEDKADAGGLYKSEDYGTTWTKISDDRIDTLLWPFLPIPVRAVTSVGASGSIFVLVVVSDGENPDTGFVFLSQDDGASWTQLESPQTDDDRNPQLYISAQGSVHGALIADPVDPNVCYVAGDAQATYNGTFPNSLGASDYSGRHFRIDASRPSPQFTHTTHQTKQQCFTTGQVTAVPPGTPCATQYGIDYQPHALSGCTKTYIDAYWCSTGEQYWSNFNATEHTWAACDPASCVPLDDWTGTLHGTSPHADSRWYTFDANGDLLTGGDGGIHRRTNPRSSHGDWFSLAGDLAITEFSTVAFDPRANILFAGAQDNGVHQQVNAGARMWAEISNGGDGQSVGVDLTTSPTVTYRYHALQYLAHLRRLAFNASNDYVGTFEGSWPLNPYSLDPGHPFLPAGQDSGEDAGDGGEEEEEDRGWGSWGSVGEKPRVRTPQEAEEAFAASFATPFSVNSVNGTRIVFAATDMLFESFDMGSTVVPVLHPAIASGIRPVYGAKLGSNALPEYLAAADDNSLYVRTGLHGHSWQIVPTPYTLVSISLDNDLNIWAACYRYVLCSLEFNIETSSYATNWTTHVSNIAPVIRASLLTSYTYFTSNYFGLYGGVWTASGKYYAGTRFGVYEYSIADDSWSRTAGNLGDPGALPAVIVTALLWESETSTLYAATLGRGAYMYRSSAAPLGAPLSVTLTNVSVFWNASGPAAVCVAYRGSVTWTAPASPELVAGYELWAGMTPTIEVKKLGSYAASSAEVEYTTIEQTVQAAAQATASLPVVAPYLLVFPVHIDGTRGQSAAAVNVCATTTATPSFSSSVSPSASMPALPSPSRSPVASSPHASFSTSMSTSTSRSGPASASASASYMGSASASSSSSVSTKSGAASTTPSRSVGSTSPVVYPSSPSSPASAFGTSGTVAIVAGAALGGLVVVGIAAYAVIRCRRRYKQGGARGRALKEGDYGQVNRDDSESMESCEENMRSSSEGSGDGHPLTDAPRLPGGPDEDASGKSPSDAAIRVAAAPGRDIREGLVIQPPPSPKSGRQMPALATVKASVKEIGHAAPVKEAGQAPIQDAGQQVAAEMEKVLPAEAIGVVPGPKTSA